MKLSSYEKGYTPARKVPQYRDITKRQLDIKSGSEGPKYDLYSYTDYIVHQNGETFILHDGLGVYLKVNKQIVAHGRNSRHLFKSMTGFENEKSFMKAYNKIRSRCPRCHGKRFEWQSGYPGESLKICLDCKEIVDSSFNEFEII